MSFSVIFTLLLVGSGSPRIYRLSDALDRLQSAGTDGLDERLIILFVLIRVPLREVADRPVERVGLAEIRGHGDRVSGPGVRPREGPPARARVELEVGGKHRLDDDRRLHVAQLPPIQVAILLDAL